MDYFSEEQVYNLISDIGIHVVSETNEVWTCLCPFHSNTNSPAFAVNKHDGTYICFNAACAASGNMASLIMKLTDKTRVQAERVIYKAKQNKSASMVQLVQQAMTDEPLPEFKQSVLDGMRSAFWSSNEAQAYMKGRGFNENTLEHYGIGYSSKKGLVGVPMHDVQGNPIGLIGRSIHDKRFENSKKLPKSRTLWNIHRAKRHATTVITEASFDAMRVYQATGIEAVATLGSQFSPAHAEQVNRYFTHVVIMTDDDQKLSFKGNCRPCNSRGFDSCAGHNTGFELGQSIAGQANGPVVSWAHLDSLKRYDGAKDAGDLSDEDIRYAIKNSVSNLEMVRKSYA